MGSHRRPRRPGHVIVSQALSRAVGAWHHRTMQADRAPYRPYRAPVIALALCLAGLGASAKSPAVDLQASLCGELQQTVRALEVAPRGEPFTVWLFDDAALTLYAKGLRLRLRDKGGASAELTLKVADQDCKALPKDAIPNGEGKCEYDLHGAKLAGAASISRELPLAKAAEITAGRVPLAASLSATQQRFLQQAGAWPLPAGLRPLGPTRVTSYRGNGKRALSLDVSELPGGEHYIEVSRKVPLADAARLRDAFEADLAKAGVPVCADQSAQAATKLNALLRRP